MLTVMAGSMFLGYRFLKTFNPVAAEKIDDVAQTAKDIAFQLRAQFAEKLVVVLGGDSCGKPSLTVCFSDDMVAAGNDAGKLVREAGKLIQGGGGGQAHFATAGGKNPDGLKAATDKLIELLTI